MYASDIDYTLMILLLKLIMHPRYFTCNYYFQLCLFNMINILDILPKGIRIYLKLINKIFDTIFFLNIYMNILIIYLYFSRFSCNYFITNTVYAFQ